VPTKNPRINVVLDTDLYDKVQTLAEKEGVSLSMKVRDLLKEATEIQEDIYLAEFASERDRTRKESKALSHDETWS
jgi:predicted DNA-binding protein